MKFSSNSYSNLIGEELLRISNSQYFYNGIACLDDIGEIELVFSSGKTVCINLRNDGESINVRNEEMIIPKGFKISEKETASWEKLNLEKALCFIGKEVASITKMIDHYIDQKTDVTSGLKISFNDQSFFVYYNCGDEAKFLINELPCYAGEGIETRWQ